MKKSALATLTVLLAASAALATDSRYREFVIGERAAGMGGAAIAIARDVDAVYANPAGLASSQGNSISLSASLYGWENNKIRNGLGYGADASGSSFVSIPSAVGGVARLGDEWVVGFGIFTPNQNEDHIVEAVANRTRFYHYSFSDKTMWIGPAIAWKPGGSRFSLGAGVFAVYRSLGMTMSEYARNDALANMACDLQTLGALATLGARCDFGDGWHAGLTLQTPTATFWDDGKFSLNGMDAETGFNLGIYTEDVDADNYIPLQVGFGLGKDFGETCTIAFDALWHPSATYDLMEWRDALFDLSPSIHLHSVLDVSLGGEIVVAEKYPVRLGVYTAFSGIDLPSGNVDLENRAGMLDTSDVDMYGVTFSVGRRVENVTVNLGIDYAFGHGRDIANGRDGGYERTPCDRNVILCSLSTSYYF